MAKTQGKRLTVKQKAFLIEYQKDWNGTRAALAAGFSKKGPSESAYQLLQNPSVQKALEREMNERLRKVGVHSEKVLTELAKIGFSDVAKAYNDNGTLKQPKDWPEELRGVISGVETFEEFEGRGDDRTLTGYTKKLRTYDKVECLKILSQYLKLIGNGKHAGTQVAVIVLEPGSINKPANSGISVNVMVNGREQEDL